MPLVQSAQRQVLFHGTKKKQKKFLIRHSTSQLRLLNARTTHAEDKNSNT
jgi:hypothetical protein